MKAITSVLFSALVLNSGMASAQVKSTPLTGAWRLTKVQVTGPNARTVMNPQPSLYLFTGGHYSVQSVNSEKPRPNLPQDLSKATAAELRDVYGPFTANSGTYEVKGDTLMTHPIVAKNPGVMAPGQTNTRTFKIEGKTLTLMQHGTAANPNVMITQTLTRVE